MTRPVSLFDAIPQPLAEELTEVLLQREGVTLERIVSHGHVTPEDQAYDQPWDEWVLLLSGGARLWIHGSGEVTLRPGDQLLLPAGRRHRVTWTDPDLDTVWLALHLHHNLRLRCSLKPLTDDPER